VVVARDAGGSSCGLNVAKCGRRKFSSCRNAYGCVGRHLGNGRVIGCLDEKGRKRGSAALPKLGIKENLDWERLICIFPNIIM
jgi:hypothetical protein